MRMRFFVPGGRGPLPDEEGEALYQRARRFVEADYWPVTGRRLFRLTYRQRGRRGRARTFEARVGRPLAGIRGLTVAAIFYSHAYVVCTRDGAGRLAVSLLVGHDEVETAEDFE